MKQHMFAMALGASIFAFIAQAQDVAPVSFGAKAGINGSTYVQVPEEEVSKESLRAGFTAGGWMRFNTPGNVLHVQGEVLYSQYRAAFENNSNQDRLLHNMQAIDVAMLVGLRAGVGAVGIAFQAGPVLSNAIGRKLEIRPSSSTYYEVEIENQALWSLQGGVSVEFDRLLFNLRYQHGLSAQEFRPKSFNNINLSGQRDYKQSSFIFTVGFRLL